MRLVQSPFATASKMRIFVADVNISKRSRSRLRNTDCNGLAMSVEWLTAGYHSNKINLSSGKSNEQCQRKCEMWNDQVRSATMDPPGMETFCNRNPETISTHTRVPSLKTIQTKLQLRIKRRKKKENVCWQTIKIKCYLMLFLVMCSQTFDFLH